MWQSSARCERNACYFNILCYMGNLVQCRKLQQTPTKLIMISSCVFLPLSSLRRRMKARAPPPPQAPQPAPRHIFRNTVPDGGGTSGTDAKENILRPTVDLQLTLPQGYQTNVTEDGRWEDGFSTHYSVYHSLSNGFCSVCLVYMLHAGVKCLLTQSFCSLLLCLATKYTSILTFNHF